MQRGAGSGHIAGHAGGDGGPVGGGGKVGDEPAKIGFHGIF